MLKHFFHILHYTNIASQTNIFVKGDGSSCVALSIREWICPKYSRSVTSDNINRNAQLHDIIFLEYCPNLLLVANIKRIKQHMCFLTFSEVHYHIHN